MSYTYPDGQPQGIARHMVNQLREMLIGEIIAINGYRQHIANSAVPELNQVWHTIMLDEKQHYHLLMQLLRKYDPEQKKQYERFKGTLPPISTAHQPYQPAYSLQLLLNNIRSDIKGECEAIILYEQNLHTFPYKDMRDVIRYIINDETGHVERLNQTLHRLDQDQPAAISITHLPE